MALTFKHECQGCGAELRPDGDAFICAYECTFCADCAGRTDNTCPNCGGELVPRPKWRGQPAADVVGSSCALAS